MKRQTVQEYLRDKRLTAGRQVLVSEIKSKERKSEMKTGECITLGTDQIICENVQIINVTQDSITVGDVKGNKLELDLDAITVIS